MAVQNFGTPVYSIQREWKLCSLSKLRLHSNMRSSEFVIPSGTRIRLDVFKFSTYCYWFYLHPLTPFHVNPEIHWTVSFVDRYGREVLSEKGRGAFENYFGTCIRIKTLDIRVGEELLVDDTLIFRCTLSVDGKDDNDEDLHHNTLVESTHVRRDQTEVLQQGTQTEEPDPLGCRKIVVQQGTQTDKLISSEMESVQLLEKLSSDFEKFYETEMDTDCVLKVGETKFPAHRTLLAARSAVLAAMFHHDMSENCNGEANLQDVDATTFSDVLYYIYCGKIRGLTADSAVSVFTVADKYALLDLREICFKFLLQNITLKNICDVALLSHTHGEEELENRVVTFIDENIKVILESDEWNEFFAAKPAVAGKFLSAAYLASKANKN